jgi:hypothetical protein
MSQDRARLALDLVREGDQISGHVHCDDGPPRPFHGWIGLIALITRLLEDARTQT